MRGVSGTCPHWLACATPSPIRSIPPFQTTVLLVLAAHAAVLFAVWYSPAGFRVLLWLNTVVALGTLLYAASRARYILTARDWPYLGLIVFELAVLSGAIWAFRGNHRAPAVFSSVAFGLHACASLAATVFAFTFKITRLM